MADGALHRVFAPTTRCLTVLALIGPAVCVAQGLQCHGTPLSSEKIDACKTSGNVGPSLGESARLCPPGNDFCEGPFPIPTAGSDLEILSFHSVIGSSQTDKAIIKWTCPTESNDLRVSVVLWLEAWSIAHDNLPCKPGEHQLDVSKAPGGLPFKGRVRALVRIGRSNCLVPVYLLARLHLPRTLEVDRPDCPDGTGCLVANKNLKSKTWRILAGKAYASGKRTINEEPISIDKPEPCAPIPVTLTVDSNSPLLVAEVRF